MRSQSLEFLKAIVDAPSPSGFEEPVAELFRNYVRPWTDRLSTDISGNVIAAINPDAAVRVMLAAHMDEIGFIVHHISEYGLLHFGPVGGNDGGVAVGQRVWVRGRERTIPGVVGYKAVHLMDMQEVREKPEIKNLWIDIGASSKEEAEALVDLGSCATLDNGFQALHGNYAAGRAFDNKLGLLIVAETLRALREGRGPHPEVGIFAVATTQEEIGSRGAKTAAFAIDPRTALAVDMGQAKDYPGVIKRQVGEFALGRGVGISRGANTNAKVFDILRSAAEEEGIPYQVTVAPGQSPTDERQLQVNRGGVASGLIEIPLRYMHTPSEVACLDDVESAIRLMTAYCRRITPDTNFVPG